MSYTPSYFNAIEHKYRFMNVYYKGNRMVPAGYFPLECSNLKNVKLEHREKLVIRALNQVTSRLGAIVSLPLTLLDMAVSGIVGTIFHGISFVQKEKNLNVNTILTCVSNRMYANMAVIGLTFLRVIFAGMTPLSERKMDTYITRRMVRDGSAF